MGLGKCVERGSTAPGPLATGVRPLGPRDRLSRKISMYETETEAEEGYGGEEEYIQAAREAGKEETRQATDAADQY